jgi:hypothetical protein
MYSEHIKQMQVISEIARTVMQVLSPGLIACRANVRNVCTLCPALGVMYSLRWM